ncbi:SpoIIAA family protein [Salegentibacter salegens]|uniref:SpoIIAA-like n=1 Tax=Salegentibacter salegens TaxID=143223 RepID=A0A1M7N1W1_9FLAO|nr:STAS/SEC14 domain-containing protein [Salegentibacter salegens]PRX52369.1 SpoIIAA-like protein [Salegentibacter salegens]SHM97504.1 SpoIIAA-like [Salegentibacter salegens]
MEKTFEFAENVVGFLINEEIDQKKIEEILSEIKDRLENVSPICLYIEDESDEGISLGGFLKAVKFHFSHSEDLYKMAIVTDDKLFKKSMDVKDFIVPADVKSFEKKERMKAMNWVMI